MITDYPSLLSRRHELQRNFAEYCKSFEPANETCEDFIPNPWGLQFPVMNSRKKKHYWVYSGSPGVGKTYYFMDKLVERFRCLEYNVAETFQMIDSRSQFVLLDEYNEMCIPLYRLNKMCDGNYQYPVKGLSAVKLNRPIVIVCSNFAPEVLYQVGLNLLMARFNVVFLGDEFILPDDQGDINIMERTPVLTDYRAVMMPSKPVRSRSPRSRSPRAATTANLQRPRSPSTGTPIASMTLYEKYLRERRKRGIEDFPTADERGQDDRKQSE
jgi:hypothetical protein